MEGSWGVHDAFGIYGASMAVHGPAKQRHGGLHGAPWRAPWSAIEVAMHGALHRTSVIPSMALDSAQ